MIFDNTFARRSALKTDASPTTRFGSTAVALATLLAVFVTIGPLATPPAAAADATILGSSSATGLVGHSDTSGVEVGTKFKALSDGSATGMRFWKDRDTMGSHEGTLWTASGTKLSGATFTSETASGWQTAKFDQPVALKTGQTYVVSYYAPKGQYAATHEFTGKSQSPLLEIATGSGVYAYGSSSRFPTSTYRNSTYWVDVTFAPKLQTAPAPAPEPAPTPTPTPTPTPPSAPSTGFPSAATTGVPTGTTLSSYTGPCRITTPNTVIDSRTVNCALRIEAPGVKITRSVINGSIYNDDSGAGSFSLSDSQVNIGPVEGTGIGDGRFTVTRVEVTGGSRSVNCAVDCTVEDSWLHGQFRDDNGRAHESGIRMGSGSVIRGNTIACDAPPVLPDAGCSAALTGYGDFAIVQNNTIDGNLFVAGHHGYCTYGGSTTGKPYSAGVNNIRFTNNVWQRGESGLCGIWGPITSFDSNAPGNVWSNNKWDDGTPVAPAN